MDASREAVLAELRVGPHPAQPGKWARLVLEDAKELGRTDIDMLDAAAAYRGTFREMTAPPIAGAVEVEGIGDEGAWARVGVLGEGRPCERQGHGPHGANGRRVETFNRKTIVFAGTTPSTLSKFTIARPHGATLGPATSCCRHRRLHVSTRRRCAARAPHQTPNPNPNPKP